MRRKFTEAKPGDIVGKIGLEVEYDSILRGQQRVALCRDDLDRTHGPRAVRRRLHRARGGTTDDHHHRPAIAAVHRFDVARGLSGKRGAMVAMTPKGEVLAYYSYPNFDPNAFIGRVDPAMYRALSENPDKPMYNRVIQGYYPPASPFKLAIAAVALKLGLVTMDCRMRQPCSGSYQPRESVVEVLEEGGAWQPDLARGDCDVVRRLLLPAGAADRCGHAHQGAELMGFGSASGIDLPNESRRRFPASVKSYVNRRGVSTGAGERCSISPSARARMPRP